MNDISNVTNRAVPIGMVNTVNMVQPIITVEPSEMVKTMDDGKTLETVKDTVNNVKQSSENEDTIFLSTLKQEVNTMADVTTTLYI